MEPITGDTGFQNGFYYSNEEVREGLARHTKIRAVVGFSTEFFKQEHWRTPGFTSLEDFQIGFMEAYFYPIDSNDLLYMAWKWQRGDVSRHTGGELEAALGRIQAKPSSCRSTKTCSSRCATARRSRR
jgi:homoserine O-acetyltransferase